LVVLLRWHGLRPSSHCSPVFENLSLDPCFTCCLVVEVDRNAGDHIGCLDDKVKKAITVGACGSVVVKALCYKPEGRGFDI
jgi:hypothetical protein